MRLEDLTWTEAKEQALKGTVVVVPVGSTEEHGPHLPVCTDSLVATRIAGEACLRAGAIVAPSVHYGYNEKELAFPGTVSVKTLTLQNYLFDIGNSLGRTGFKKVLFLNGHGWNSAIIVQVCHMLSEETDIWAAGLNYWEIVTDVLTDLRQSAFPGGMSHACEGETSLFMYLDPGRTKMDRAINEIGGISSKYAYNDMVKPSPVFITPRFDELTTSGVIGEPLLATPAKGEAIFRRRRRTDRHISQGFQRVLPKS